MKNILCLSCAVAPKGGYSRLLRTLGYNVTCGSIAQMLPSLRSGRMPVDLVIAECDALAREDDEMLRQLKRAVSEVPLILVSTCMTVESYLRALAIGVHEYFCTPMQDHSIIHLAQELLAGEPEMNSEVL